MVVDTLSLSVGVGHASQSLVEEPPVVLVLEALVLEALVLEALVLEALVLEALVEAPVSEALVLPGPFPPLLPPLLPPVVTPKPPNTPLPVLLLEDWAALTLDADGLPIVELPSLPCAPPLAVLLPELAPPVAAACTPSALASCIGELPCVSSLQPKHAVSSIAQYKRGFRPWIMQSARWVRVQATTWTSWRAHLASIADHWRQLRFTFDPPLAGPEYARQSLSEPLSMIVILKLPQRLRGSCQIAKPPTR